MIGQGVFSPPLPEVFLGSGHLTHGALSHARLYSKLYSRVIGIGSPAGRLNETNGGN